MKHTPGPWTTSGIRIKIDRQPYLQVVSEVTDMVVAFVPYSDLRPGEHIQSHADQRVLAAAPDLLAALWAMMRAENNQHHTAAGKLAYAAIAKATGEEP